MKHLPLIILALLFSCSSPKKGKNVQLKEHESPLDLPPKAPVPPQSFCFQLAEGGKSSSMEITVTGDSVIGKTDYNPNGNTDIKGTINGIVYETTLLISYQEGAGPIEDQLWKMEADSIFKQPLDSMEAADTIHLKILYPGREFFCNAMHKVDCAK